MYLVVPHLQGSTEVSWTVKKSISPNGDLQRVMERTLNAANYKEQQQGYGASKCRKSD